MLQQLFNQRSTLWCLDFPCKTPSTALWLHWPRCFLLVSHRLIEALIGFKYFCHKLISNEVPFFGAVQAALYYSGCTQKQAAACLNHHRTKTNKQKKNQYNMNQSLLCLLWPVLAAVVAFYFHFIPQLRGINVVRGENDQTVVRGVLERCRWMADWWTTACKNGGSPSCCVTSDAHTFSRR